MPDDINRSSTPGQGAAVTPPPPSGAPVPPPGAPAPVSTDPVEAGPGGDTEEAAKQEASKVADTAKEEARATAAEAKRQAREVWRQGQAELSEQAGSQQQRLASGLQSFATEMGQMADGAEEPGVGAQVARWASGMAGTPVAGSRSATPRASWTRSSVTRGATRARSCSSPAGSAWRWGGSPAASRTPATMTRAAVRRHPAGARRAHPPRAGTRHRAPARRPVTRRPPELLEPVTTRPRPATRPHPEAGCDEHPQRTSRPCVPRAWPRRRLRAAGGRVAG